MDEKRNSRRSRVLRDGKVVFNGSKSLIDCIIRDKTETGAKLQVFPPTVLPKSFLLLCMTERIMYPAQIVWRRGHHVGVAFVGTPKPEARRKKANKQIFQTLD